MDKEKRNLLSKFCSNIFLGGCAPTTRHGKNENTMHVFISFIFSRSCCGFISNRVYKYFSLIVTFEQFDSKQIFLLAYSNLIQSIFALNFVIEKKFRVKAIDLTADILVKIINI